MAFRREKEFTFICDAIPEKSFRFFQDVRNKNEFCDVTFRVGNQATIYAHRIVIAAVIPYLREVLMLRNGLQSGEDGISIPEIDSGTFKCLIEFAYTYKLKINEENVWKLLGAACYLGVEEVREECCDFVVDTLKLENAFNARQLASNLNCSELVKDIDSYVAENFVKISQTTEFLDFPSSYVEDLLCRDDLFVDNEQQVLDAVLRWVKSSTEERSIVLPDMMRKIRMAHVKPEILAKLTITEDVIRTSVLCRDLADEARNYNLFPELKKEVCSFVTEPRKGMKNSDDEDNGYICKMIAELKYMTEYYDLVKGKRHTKDGNIFYQTDASFAKVENKMYFFRWGDTVQYNPLTNVYEYLLGKPTPTTSTAVATFQNKIYLFGGKAGAAVSNAVECFDPKNNQWKRMKPMHKGRLGISAVPLGNYIYVVGGRDWSVVYDCIERFDPLMNKWSSMSSMLTKRTYAGAAALKGNIYICGGSTLRNAGGVIGSVEVYDPIVNLCKFIAPLNVPRWRGFVLSSRGKLYAFEGEDGNKDDVFTLEIYDPESDKWIVGSLDDSSHLASGVVMSSDIGN